MPIKEYRIVWTEESDQLTAAVNALIAAGWQPLGAPYFANAHHRQAMVR